MCGSHRRSWSWTTTAFLAALFCLFGNAASAGESPTSSPAAAATLCQTNQITIFACALQSENVFRLCLDRDEARLSLVVTNAHGVTTGSPITDLQEWIGAGAAKGANVTLEFTSAQSNITMFMSLNAADMVQPIIRTENDVSVLKETCKTPNFIIDAGVIKLRNEDEFVNIIALQRVGLARVMTDPPDWPE